MSNFQCKECGTTLIDCGKGVGYKTAREIELEETVQRLKDEFIVTIQANRPNGTAATFLGEPISYWLNLNKQLEQSQKQYNAVVQQNQNLQQELATYREALVQISQNEHCVCSLDGTCQPQRQAMNALAEGVRI